MAPVHRFADREWRRKAETNLALEVQEIGDPMHTADYPVTSLADEALYTVGSGIRTPIFYAPKWQTGAGPTALLRFHVPPGFPAGSRVALEPGFISRGEQHHLPPSVAEVELAGGKPVLSFELSIPKEFANQTISLHVTGTVVSRETALYHRVPTVSVPRGAHLEFAMGVLEPAWGQGQVEFQVRACAGNDCETIFNEVVDPGTPDQRLWQPRRVDLSPLAGRDISFSFNTRLISDAAGAFSLPVWGNPTLYAPDDSRRSDVNIILISIDTLAANHLPTYGYRFPTAPFLDGVLAKEGTVFEHVVAAATTTPQSHMSMLTSVQPCQHGVTTGMERVRSEFVTLAEVLRHAGYETGAVTEDGWLGYQHGFGHGFNFYAENKSANVMTPEGQVDVTLAKARSWIARNDDKPFFLFLHTFQVHDPYTPPKEYTGLFRERDDGKVDDSSPRELRELVAYDQEIRYTDDELKAFFEFLRERGLLDNTVIVVTSDHGEEFFQHGEWGHGRNLFEPVTRVPLILWGPGRVPQGARQDRTVGHIDLMPTILALAGVDVPAQATGRNILAPAPSAEPTPSDARFTESRTEIMVSRNYQKIPVLPPGFLIQQGSRKMARYRQGDGFVYEAYDLDSDPQEMRNRLPADAAQFETMKRMLDDYEASCADRLQQKNDVEPSREIELDPEREQKLRALGYLQ